MEEQLPKTQVSEPVLEQVVYTLDSFIEHMDRFMIYQEKIEVNLPAALYMLAIEIKGLRSRWECK